MGTFTLIPKMLYRVFDEKKYAEQFINEGTLRFATLSNYEAIEDAARVDRTEGYGAVTRPGESLVWDERTKTLSSIPGTENLHVDGDGRGTFINCFSAPPSSQISDLPRKFGKYIVRVNDPDSLESDIQDAIRKDKILNQNLPQLEVATVRYDKGEHQESLSEEEIDTLGWSQKPRPYSDEFEVRFKFWTFHELIDSPSHYFISVGKPLSYCELITRMD
jgi:hypothetical protein